MTNQQYYSVFTQQGLTLLKNTMENGTKLGITHMAFGDGGGTVPIPNENFTQLVNEVYRTQLNSLSRDLNNTNWLRAETTVASNIGGFNVRELGLYADNVLIAYSNYPSTYKPNSTDSNAYIMAFGMVLQIDNATSLELKVDPDIVFATIQYVTDVEQEIYKNTISIVKDVIELNKLSKWDQRSVFIKSNGLYFYESKTDQWLLDNSNKVIRQISSIQNLRQYEPERVNEIIKTGGYYEDWTSTTNLIKGGASYYYDNQDMTSNDDGLFTIVTKNNARWKLKLEKNSINLYQCGLKMIGEDETSLLQDRISIINSYAKQHGQRLEMDGCNNKLLVSDTISVDINYIKLSNFYLYTSLDFTPTNITAILKLDGSSTELQSTPSLMENIVIQGPGWRTDRNVAGLLCNASTNLSTIKGLRVMDVKYNLVLGSNTYLISFVDFTFTRAQICLIDSVSAGFEDETVNAGENISFHRGSFGESYSLAKLIKYNNGSHLAFYNCSFDYSGGNESQDYIQFDLDSGQYEFYSCHFESGNNIDSITTNYFNIGDYTNISFFGGWIIFNTENKIPYFFFCKGNTSDRSTNPHINLYDTWVYAPAVDWWSNFGLDIFKPNIAVTDYTTSGKFQELNTLMNNPDMLGKTMSDAFFANYTDEYRSANVIQTDPQTNDILSVSFNSSVKAIEMKRLQRTSSILNGGIFYLLVPRQPSRYNPHLEISYKSTEKNTLSSGIIYITCTPVRWSGQFNKYGIPINMGSNDIIGSLKISSLSTEIITSSIVDYAAQRMDYKNANYILVTVNMSSITEIINFQITDIKLSQAD